MPWDMDIWEYDDERDGKTCWLGGHQWAWPPWEPLWMEIWYTSMQHYTWYGREEISDPLCHGMDWRMKDGLMYISAVPTTEEERKEREPKFREKAAAILEDPFGYWDKYKPEMKQVYDRLIPFDVEKAADHELAHHLWDCWFWIRRMVDMHFVVLTALSLFSYLFQSMLKEFTGILPSDVKFSKLMSGFDNSLYQMNKRLAELATRAMELGLKELLDTTEPEELLSKLEESDAGRKWLAEFRDFLKDYGVVMMRMPGVSAPSWNEKPSLVILEVKRMMAIGGVHAPDVQRERLTKEREETEKEVLSKVPEEHKEWFAKLMKAAQAYNYFNEDHTIWCEQFAGGLLRRAALEAGKRLVKIGVLDEPKDALLFHRDEISLALQMGTRCGARDIVKRRKEEYERYLKAEHPLLLGDTTKFAEVVAAEGILAIGGGPRVAEPEEVGATLVGAAGAPGRTEGIARVIMSIDELPQLQPGEVLVTPFTSAPWTPAFGIAKAVVADVGGALAHAVIVGREYAIPTVVGTQEGTRKIKTGQKVRVDGDLLRVYVLD